MAILSQKVRFSFLYGQTWQLQVEKTAWTPGFDYYSQSCTAPPLTG
jgi:hypothetical protein